MSKLAPVLKSSPLKNNIYIYIYIYIFIYLFIYIYTSFINFQRVRLLYIHVTVRRYRFIFNNQPDALFIKIYSLIKLYMFLLGSGHYNLVCKHNFYYIGRTYRIFWNSSLFYYFNFIYHRFYYNILTTLYTYILLILLTPDDGKEVVRNM